MSDIEKRKIEHTKLAKNPESQINKPLFEDIKLKYVTLPNLDLKDVDTSSEIFGKKLAQPLIIASMTGGTNHALKINTNLAIAAEETKVAFGVGSQRIALEIKEAEASFKLARKHAPTTVIFANMGAIQLNFGKGVEDFQRIVDMIEADGLYLHINALQEAIQPEGDTNFSKLLPKIENLVKKVNVPIYAKEVGHGIDKKSARKLIEVGISGIDVAGANGTSWAWIEAKRRGSDNLAKWFMDFGISTEDSILNTAKQSKEVKIIASGGIRNPIQGLKSHTLGAHYYSAAYPFLKPALESADALIETINEWEKGLKVAMFCTETKSWS